MLEEASMPKTSSVRLNFWLVTDRQTDGHRQIDLGVDSEQYYHDEEQEGPQCRQWYLQQRFWIHNEHQPRTCNRNTFFQTYCTVWWLGSRVVSVLDSGAKGPGFKSQPRRCRVVLGILFTLIVPLFTKQQNW